MHVCLPTSQDFPIFQPTYTCISFCLSLQVTSTRKKLLKITKEQNMEIHHSLGPLEGQFLAKSEFLEVTMVT